MPIIPDGVYKLHNDQDLNQVVDLITGGPGPINGITYWNAHNDKVRVVLCRGLPLMRLTCLVVVGYECRAGHGQPWVHHQECECS